MNCVQSKWCALNTITIIFCLQQVVTMFGHRTKCTVKLQLAKALNFEDMTKPLEVTIKVLDKGKLELSRSWSFTVTNVNEPPRVIILIKKNSLLHY